MAQISYFLIFFLVLYIAQTLAVMWLERLNLMHMRKYGRSVPPFFEGFIDAPGLARIEAYSTAKSHLSCLRELVSESLLLVLILSGFLAFLEGLTVKWDLHAVPAGLFFFLVPGAILYAVELPFGWYDSFVVEEKFGFNRSTPRLWIADHLKSTLLGGCLMALLLSALIWMIQVSPLNWWLWGFAVISAVQISLAVLYPVLIAPLFNRFEPVQDELLAKKIRTVMEENGIRLKKILQMNAGIRSRHTNAYFTGLGKTKQVVLYDTLLESHTHQEILAVLAHELGHLKKKHILKQTLIFEASLLIAFYLSYRMLTWPVLYSSFGFDPRHTYIGLFILGVLWQKAGFFVQPFYMAVSRRFERQADLFSLKILKTPAPLLSALKRLAADNMSNLRPHPLYVRFHYSHPPLLERAALLEKADSPGSGGLTRSMLDRRVTG